MGESAWGKRFVNEYPDLSARSPRSGFLGGVGPHQQELGLRMEDRLPADGMRSMVSS